MTCEHTDAMLGDLSYEYDAVGRRTKMGGSFARTISPSSLTSTAYNSSNQQTTFSNQTLTYDLNGNLTGDGTNTYTWNARNQLASISGSVTASYQYDALGRRISKSVNAASTSYLYDGTNIIQEQSGGAAIANMLTGKTDEVFSRSDAAGVWNVLRDGLGSTIALTDSAGVAQTEYSYDAFGNTTASGATSTNTSQYTGRENDGIGLYFYRARYQSPTSQRFISEDPIRFSGGDVNLYAYVGNNPTNLVDPRGTDAITFNNTDGLKFASLMPPMKGRKSCGGNDPYFKVPGWIPMHCWFPCGMASYSAAWAYLSCRGDGKYNTPTCVRALADAYRWGKECADCVRGKPWPPAPGPGPEPGPSPELGPPPRPNHQTPVTPAVDMVAAVTALRWYNHDGELSSLLNSRRVINERAERL